MTEPKKPIGLGDAVQAVAKRVGLRPCDACKKRREALNKLVPQAWPLRKAKAT